MKILLISSSPRKEKSQTFLLAKEVIQGCNNKETNIEILHLRDLKIEFCRHCETCHKKILCCPIKDDVYRVLNMMIDTDGIVLASPNYINQVTGSMKTLFDRSSHFIHCLCLMGKYVAGVVSSGSGQDKDVLDYIKYYAHTCGAQYVGSVSACAPVNKENMGEALKLGNKLYSAIKEKKVFPAQLRIIEEHKEHFKKIMQIRKNEWIQEYQYWLNKGWL